MNHEAKEKEKDDLTYAAEVAQDLVDAIDKEAAALADVRLHLAALGADSTNTEAAKAAAKAAFWAGYWRQECTERAERIYLLGRNLPVLRDAVDLVG